MDYSSVLPTSTTLFTGVTTMLNTDIFIMYSLTVDKLHQMYSDLLKRLDDNSNEVRIAVAKTLAAYARSDLVKCFLGDVEGVACLCSSDVCAESS